PNPIRIWLENNKGPQVLTKPFSKIFTNEVNNIFGAPSENAPEYAPCVRMLSPTNLFREYTLFTKAGQSIDEIIKLKIIT
ncbi:hypothetical protein OFB78_31045, partial [Escherichia coli]|nr:hypothetical protein [Escherichia coli]